MTDWIEHDGGPQPVDDDAWVEARWPFSEGRYFSAEPDEMEQASELPWEGNKLRYRILNQHLIDAALKRGIELGLEAAARACLEKAEYFAHNDAFVVGQPLSNTRERYACVRCAYEIRAINPDTIAREAQDMGSEKET